MNKIFKPGITVLVFPLAIFAQHGPGNNPRKDTADSGGDSHWASLQTLTKSSPANAVSDGAKAGGNDQKSKVAAQAERKRQAAQSAKDFYTNYPDHANAEEARKIEAIGELRGVKEGDDAQEKKAISIAKTFRDNRGHSVNARTEVALAMDRLELSRKIKARTVADRPTEKEKIAEAVRAELGHTPELHAYYAEVARSADMFTAKRIAANLLQWPAAPKVRAEAQAIMDRDALLGQRLNLRYTALDGSLIDLAQTGGGVTVVYAWAPSAGTEMLQSLTRYQNSVPPGVQFVYLALGGSAKDVAALSATAPIKGRFSHQTGVAVSAALRALKLTTVPYLFVLNKDGHLAGFGPVSEFTGLLALAMR